MLGDMENFTFHNPTRILFGRGQIASLDKELPTEARVLLLAGGGSIKKNGVYDQVIKALEFAFDRQLHGTRGDVELVDDAGHDAVFLREQGCEQVPRLHFIVGATACQCLGIGNRLA
jgi:hypothetical protein